MPECRNCGIIFKRTAGRNETLCFKCWKKVKRGKDWDKEKKKLEDIK